MVNKMMMDEYYFLSKVYDPFIEHWLARMRREITKFGGISPGESVLELACGTGKQAACFADLGAIVTGIDISLSMLKRAKARERQNLTFVLGDGRAMPFGNAQFDYVSAALAFHEVSEDDRIKFIDEAQRVMKKDGTFILADYTTPQRKGFCYYMHHLAEKLIGGRHYQQYLQWIEEGGLFGFIERIPMRITDYKLMYGESLGVVRLQKV